MLWYRSFPPEEPRGGSEGPRGAGSYPGVEGETDGAAP